VNSIVLGLIFPPVVKVTNCVSNVVEVTFSILQDQIFKVVEVAVAVVSTLRASVALTT
jgi:hypothetical protein